MPLIYSLISRSVNVLAEFSDENVKGNFLTISRVILKKIPIQEDHRKSYIYDQYVFHYIVSNSITYLCMTDSKYNPSLAFEFLETIRHQFISQYENQALFAIAFSLNREFSPFLKKSMEQNELAEEEYRQRDENNHSVKIIDLEKQLDELKDVMIDNIDKILSQGEKIELLVDQTESLYQNGIRFRRQAVKLKTNLFTKNIKSTAIGILCIAGLFICIFFAL